MFKKIILPILLISYSNIHTSEDIGKKRKYKSSPSLAITPLDESTITTALTIVHQIRQNPRKSYYNSQRSRNLYNNSDAFKLSRSKLQDFLKCDRCFFIDRKKGTGQVPGYPFNLNSAIDTLLKNEFDTYRSEQKIHPLCAQNNLNLIPFQHPKLEEWRNSLSQGVQAHIQGTNIILTGGIDDLWVNPETNELFIVDYKSTSKKDAITLDADWQNDYKQQVEIYQWLLRQKIGLELDSKYTISDTAYFVYCNGNAQAQEFNNLLNFTTTLLPYQGNSSWVEPTVIAAYLCLQQETIPAASTSCNFCQYITAVNAHLASNSSEVK